MSSTERVAAMAQVFQEVISEGGESLRSMSLRLGQNKAYLANALRDPRGRGVRLRMDVVLATLDHLGIGLGEFGRRVDRKIAEVSGERPGVGDEQSSVVGAGLTGLLREVVREWREVALEEARSQGASGEDEAMAAALMLEALAEGPEERGR